MIPAASRGLRLSGCLTLLALLALLALLPACGSPPTGSVLVYNRYDIFRPTIATRAFTTRPRGSTLIAAVGRGVIAAHVPPTDNRGSEFRQLGTAHAYVPRYPTSGTALYVAEDVRGGAGHIVSVANAPGKRWDEVTMAVVEVAGASGPPDSRWNIVPGGAPLTSLPVTTTGPATLIAVWWGDADGSQRHEVRPNNGFRVIQSVLRAGSLVQCAVAIRAVASAGTYDVTWTAKPVQGAQLWLVAVPTGR